MIKWSDFYRPTLLAVKEPYLNPELKTKRMILWGAVSLCVVLSLCFRINAIAPDSLWLDDLWVAVLAKNADIRFLLTGQYPCSPGFVLILKSVGTWLGFGEFQLQLVPLVASLVLIPVMAKVVLDTLHSYSCAIIAAALVAVNYNIAKHSVQVKPFALDAFIMLALLYLSILCLKNVNRRYFIWFSCFSAAMALFSFVSLLFSFFAVIAVHLQLYRLLKDAGEPQNKLIGASAIGYLVISGIIFFLLIYGRGNPSLYAYWQDHFLPVHDVQKALGFFSEKGRLFFTGAYPENFRWVALLIPVGIAWLVLGRELRPLGFAIILFYGGVFMASALSLYPLGAARIDVYSYPVSIFCSVAGFRAVASNFRVYILINLVTIYLIVSSMSLCGTIRYPVNSSRKTVQLLEKYEQAGDTVIVYPWANWALGFYGKWLPVFVNVSDSTNSFYIEVERMRTHILRESWRGMDFRTSPEIVASQLGFLSEHPAKVIYVASSAHNAELQNTPNDWIRKGILEQGYKIILHEKCIDGEFSIFEPADKISIE